MADKKLALLAALDDMVSELLLYIRGEISLATESKENLHPYQQTTTTQQSAQEIAANQDNCGVHHDSLRVVRDLTNRLDSNHLPFSKRSSQSSGLASSKPSSSSQQSDRSLSRKTDSYQQSMLPDKTHRSKIFASTPANSNALQSGYLRSKEEQELPSTLRSTFTKRSLTLSSSQPCSCDSGNVRETTPSSHNNRCTGYTSTSTCSCCRTSSAPPSSPHLRIWSLQSPSPDASNRRKGSSVVAGSESKSGVCFRECRQQRVGDADGDTYTPSCSCRLHSSMESTQQSTIL